MTRATLFPMSIVAINLEGFAVNRDKIFPRKSPCFFSSSIWILLEDTKAISIPEKKADSNKDPTMTTTLKATGVIYFDLQTSF
jgi:hypothetical protein